MRCGNGNRQAGITAHAVDGNSNLSCRHQARNLWRYSEIAKTGLLVVLGLEYLTAAIDAIGAVMLAQVQLTSGGSRSEEHTSERTSLMRTSYAVFCLKKKKHARYYHKSHTSN